MTTHTPGPWTATSLPNEVILEGGEYGATLIARVNKPRRSKTPEEDRANANLIAASPDLLDWIKRRLALDTADNQGTAEWCKAVEAMIVEGQNLIAKAKGDNHTTTAKCEQCDYGAGRNSCIVCGHNREADHE